MGSADRQPEGLNRPAQDDDDGKSPGLPPVALEFQPDARELEERPLPGAARWSLYALAGLVAALIVWASLSEVDRIVTARGKLVTTAPTLVVQPLETSIVRRVAARAGQVVKKGQVLAALDPTFTEADVARLQGRLASLQAQIQRLEAELQGGDYTPGQGNAEDRRLQLLLFQKRRARFRARRLASAESLAALQAQLTTNLRDQKVLAQRLQGLREIERMRSALHQEKHESRLRVLEARNRRLEVERELQQVKNREPELRHQLARVAAEVQAFEEAWRQEAAEELVSATRERDNAAEQLAKARKRQDLVLLRAPADAVVLETARRSVGSVVQAAETMFTLVPVDVPLEAEAHIAARDIGYLRVGDSARIKLDAFSFQKHGTLKARVRSISEDVFQPRGPSAEGEPAGVYYLARFAIDEPRLKGVPKDFRLIPGMTLSAEIKVGSRSVISYFLYPIIRTFDESIREP